MGKVNDNAGLQHLISEMKQHIMKDSAIRNLAISTSSKPHFDT